MLCQKYIIVYTNRSILLIGIEKNETRDENSKIPEEDIVKLIIKQLEDTVGIVRKVSVPSYSNVTLHNNHEKLGKLFNVLCVNSIFTRLSFN